MKAKIPLNEDRAGWFWADPEVYKLKDLRVGDRMMLYEKDMLCVVLELIKPDKIKVQFISEFNNGQTAVIARDLSVIKSILPALRPDGESSKYYT